jgi:hypothetical protein
LQAVTELSAVTEQDCVDTVVAESGKLRSGRLKVRAEAGAAKEMTIRAMAAKLFIMFSFL